MSDVPFVCLYDQLDRAFSSLQISDMKAVEHEDNEYNTDYSVDPLSDPRLDKMDLFNMVDAEDRDKIMNAQPSFNSSGGDPSDLSAETPAVETTSVSGSGE